MKLLNQHEIQTVSGGVGEAFIISCMAGKLNYNRYITIAGLTLIQSAIYGLGYSYLITWENALPANKESAALGASLGIIMTFIGYDIGSIRRFQSTTVEETE